jgi:hypothetical protein
LPSRHYGYPTGEKLITEVKEIALWLMRFFERCKTAQVGHQSRTLATGDGVCYDLRIQECQDLVDRLKLGNPVVIDYFLGQNHDLQEIGKFCVAYAILKCESVLSNRFRQVTNGGEDDWLRFVIEEIAKGCAQSDDIYKNNVKFVTFNYDRSIERRIYEGLRARRMFEETIIRNFIAKDLILHVYGSVKKFDYSIDEILPNSTEIETCVQRNPSPPDYIKDSDVVSFLDEIYESAQNIRVIEPQHKKQEEECILKATDAIRNAKNIYILGYGYGFDRINSDRLKLREVIGGCGKLYEF